MKHHLFSRILLLIIILSAGCAGNGMRDSDEVLSDETIKSNVNYALHKDGRIDQTLIRIDCLNGEVTLNGIVRSEDQRRRAVDIADGVRGVKNVTSKLVIKMK